MNRRFAAESFRPIGLMLLLAAALLAGGCSHPTASSRELLSAFENKAATDLPVWVDLAGPEPDPVTGKAVAQPIAVDVESFNGDVYVIVNEELVNRAKVVLTREATQGYTRSKQAVGSLDQIHYDYSVGPGEFGQVLHVRTSTTNPEPHYHRANVLIEAPAVRGITIRTSHGDVVLEDISGEIDVTTTEGNVRLMTNRAMTEPVTIINRGGDIDYRVRGESTGVLECQVIHGQIKHRVRNGRLTVNSGTDLNNLRASLNDGRNLIQLRTMDGDIRIAVVPDPMNVGMFISGQ